MLSIHVRLYEINDRVIPGTGKVTSLQALATGLSCVCWWNAALA